jgi:8-oxo-dGTP diphosphatase
MTGSKQRERPWVTVDVVLVAALGGRLRVLLVRRKRPPFEGCWAIPGGFVEPHEPLEAAARRELWEETGAEPIHLEQLYTFGDPDRDPRGWIISVAYLARLDADSLQMQDLRPASDAGEIGWFGLDELPPLAFDHEQVLDFAARRLAERGEI